MGAYRAQSEYSILEDVLEHAYTLRKKGEPLCADTPYNRAVCAAVEVMRTFEKRFRVRYEKPDAHEATRGAVVNLMQAAYDDMDGLAAWLNNMAQHPRSSGSFLDIILSENPDAVPRKRKKRVTPQVLTPAPERAYAPEQKGRGKVIDMGAWAMRTRYA